MVESFNLQKVGRWPKYHHAPSDPPTCFFARCKAQFRRTLYAKRCLSAPGDDLGRR